MADLVPESEQQYGSILTVLGESAEQNGKMLKKPVVFTHIAFGDANDTYVQPDRKSQSLVNELYRIPVNSVDVLQATPDSVPILTVEALLPDDIYDVVIREFAAVATFNGQEYFHAIGNCARIYVPSPINNGQLNNPVSLEMTFVITSAEPIVEMNPNVITASRDWVKGNTKNVIESASKFKTNDNALKEGNTVDSLGYHQAGDGCNAPYVIVQPGTHTDGVSGAVLNGTFFNLPSGKQAELLNKHGANVAEMGATGGDSAQAASYNTEAFLRAARTGRPIIVPYHVDGWGYEDAMLELGPGQIIVGPGRNFKGIKAKSTKPVIKFGKDSYEPAFRGNGLYHLAIENNGGPCLEATWSPNWTVFDCNLRSVGAGINTLQTWQSYRANLISSQVGVSGAESWCLYLMDNTNAFQALGLIASGGSGGGVADIGRSYNVKLDTAVIESSKYGIRVGTNKDQLRGGAVHAFQLLNSNWEQCTEPLRLGDGYAVHGATLMGNYVSNKNKEIISDRTASWRIGRVEGMRATGNVFHPADDEFVFDFYMDPYFGSELRYLVEGAIKENSFKSFGAAAYKLSGYFEDVPSQANRLIASCDLELGNEKFGASHEIIFDVDVSQNSTIAISPQSPLGGYVTKIEFLNVPDGVKGTLKLGTLVNTGEIHSIDMATVTPSYGYYDVPFIGNYVRPNNRILASYVHDGASGSFKVKVTYRM
ncbi:TPA: phage tail protein [Vibrio vulnificus]|nr:phage tail protein [Vibrio vulnificus]HDY7689267.1 phage tail protein [Vibrio vulnificus]